MRLLIYHSSTRHVSQQWLHSCVLEASEADGASSPLTGAAACCSREGRVRDVSPVRMRKARAVTRVGSDRVRNTWESRNSEMVVLIRGLSSCK